MTPGHLDHPGSPLHPKTLPLITPAKSLLPYEVTYPLDLGVRMGPSLGAIILPTTGQDLLGRALRDKASAHMPWSSTDAARQALLYHPKARSQRFRSIECSCHIQEALSPVSSSRYRLHPSVGASQDWTPACPRATI